MKELDIPNFLGGVRYEVDPVYLNDNEFSHMENLDSRGKPCSNGTIEADPDNSSNNLLKKHGLAVRGSMALIAGDPGTAYATGNFPTRAIEHRMTYNSGSNVLEGHIMLGSQITAYRADDYLDPNDGLASTVEMLFMGEFSGLASATHSVLVDVETAAIMSYNDQDAVSPGGTAVIMDYDFEEAGTISTTSGSAVITGSGTSFTKLRAGSAFYIAASAATGNPVHSTNQYRVASITNDTSLTLSTTMTQTTSGKSFRAVKVRDYNPLGLAHLTAVGYFKFRTFVATFDQVAGAKLYVSEPGDPETIIASNIFQFGDFTDKIQAIIDLGDYVLILREHSTWAFYLDSVTPTNSSVIRLHPYYGCINDRAWAVTPQGVAVLTKSDGWQLLVSGRYHPILQQLKNRYSNVDTQRVIAKATTAIFANDRLIFSSINLVGTTAGDLNETTISFYDINNDVLERHVYDYANDGIGGVLLGGTQYNHFGYKVATVKADTAGRLAEADYYDPRPGTSFTILESSVPWQCRSKKWRLGDGKHEGVLRHIILEFSSNANSQVTITPYLDGVAKTAVTTPSDSSKGFRRVQFDIEGSSYHGQYLEFKFSGTFTMDDREPDLVLYRCKVLYDLQPRVGA